MKHILSIVIITMLCTAIMGCDRTGTGSGEGTFGKEGSYALGMSLGTGLASDGIYPDIDEFIQGMRDVLTDSSTRYSIDEAQQIIQEAFFALSEERSEVFRQDENTFLAENSTNPGINVTESGLQYEVIIEGTGQRPDFSDSVRVHYEGTLLDGTIFDSSYMHGEPAELPLGGVIPGWSEGLQLMTVGSTYRFFIPSDLAYGPRGAGQVIPPYSTLIFQVELLEIVSN